MNDFLNHPVISQRYFFPRRGRPDQSREFVGVGGVRLCCSYHAPYPNAKTLVHFHGNGEIVADYDDGYVQSLAELGVNVLMVEYRGYGDSEGEPELGKMLLDVRSVREQLDLASDRTVLYGRSVGAIFAVEWVSQDPDVAGLILESGVADPYQRLAIRLHPSELGATEEELKAACDRHLDHARKLKDFKNPLLVLHAEQDTLVEPAHAYAHMSYVRSEKKDLVLFPRGDHNSVLSANWPDYLACLQRFLTSL